MYVKRHNIWFFRQGSRSRAITGADTESFQPLSATHGKDKDHVFLNDGIVEGADPKSFDPLSGIISKDDKNIYCGNYIFKDEIEFHVPTFEWLGGRYFQDQNNLYCIYCGYNCYWTFVVPADAKTFRIIGQAFAVDEESVFNHGKIIEGFDPETVEMLSSYFLKDDKSVYFLRFGGEDSDDITLEKIDADADSFNLISDCYAADKDTVFFYYNCGSLAREEHLLIECIATEIDPKLFQQLEEEQTDMFWPDATDGESIFFHGRRVGLEKRQFELEDSNGRLKLKTIDLDAYFIWVSAHGVSIFPESWGIGGADPETLGDILHPLHFQRLHRDWLLSGSPCALSRDERHLQEARKGLVEVWMAFDRDELKTAMASIDDHPLDWLELASLGDELQMRAAARNDESLTLFVDRNHILFTSVKPVRRPNLGAMNNAIYRVLSHEQAARNLESLVVWGEVAREYAYENLGLAHTLACLFAFTGRPDDAFVLCELAVKNKCQSWKKLRDDEMLAELMCEPRFKKLFADLDESKVLAPDADIPF